MDIDLESEANKNPKQNLEKDELIKPYFVDLDNLLEFITEKVEKEDYGCTSTLYDFAIGMNFSKFVK